MGINHKLYINYDYLSKTQLGHPLWAWLEFLLIYYDYFTQNLLANKLLLFFYRCLERSLCTYNHDWYSYRSPVVHLWFCKSLLQTSQATSSWNARKLEEKTCIAAAIGIFCQSEFWFHCAFFCLIYSYI